MKKRIQILAGMMGFLLMGSMVAFGQKTIDWRTEATSNKWFETDNCTEVGQVVSQWWYGEFVGNEARDQPNCNDGTTPYHILRFNNNHQLTMDVNQNVDIHQLILNTGSTSSRTFGGGNTITLQQLSGAKSKIENNSTVTHTFNVPISVKNGTGELNPVSGNLVFTNNIYHNGNYIDVYGSNTLTVEGNMQDGDAAGGIAFKSAGLNVIYSTNDKGYTGPTYVENGTLSSSVNLSTSSIQVQSGATFTITENISVNSLEIQSGGTLNIEAGDTLTIRSGSNFKNEGTINLNTTGAISFQREITGSAGWRMISSPVAGTMSDLLDPIWTQGIASGADVTTGNPNVFEWNNITYDQEYSAIANLSGSFSAGHGYLVYVYADDNFDGTADAFPKTLSISGTENAVDTAPNLSSGTHSQFYLVGNPFATTIDFDAVSKTQLTDVAYVWDVNDEEGNGGKNSETTSGSWKTWNGTTGDITDGLIAPFQGFFIQGQTSGSPAPTITFGAASKSTGGTFLGKANTSTFAKARLEVSGESVSNSMWLQFSENGSSTSRVMGDAVELEALSDNFAELAAIKGGELFDIAHLSISEEVNLPISFKTTETGIYTISASNFELPSNMKLVFHDYETGIALEMNKTFSYEFEARGVKSKEMSPLKKLQSGPLHAKTSNNNRFGITIEKSNVVSNEDELATVTKFDLDQNYPNPFNPTTTIKYSVGETGPVSLTVYNVMGQKVAELVNATKTAGTYQINWNATGQASGIYYYRLQAPGQVITRQMTLIK